MSLEHINSAVAQDWELVIRLQHDGRMQASVHSAEASDPSHHFADDTVELALAGLNNHLSHIYHPSSYEARAAQEHVISHWADTPWALQAGDIITFAGVYVKPKWWQFWRWGDKAPEPKQFVVGSVHTSAPHMGENHTEPVVGCVDCVYDQAGIG